MTKKIGRQSLTDQIVVELRRRIIAGELAEGTPLRHEALAIELELSDHRAILAYAKLKDAERAVETLRKHIQRVANNLMKSLIESRSDQREQQTA